MVVMNYEPIEEREKSICLEVDGEKYWYPKSQVQINNERIYIPDWLVESNKKAKEDYKKGIVRKNKNEQILEVLNEILEAIRITNVLLGDVK